MHVLVCWKVTWLCNYIIIMSKNYLILCLLVIKVSSQTNISNNLPVCIVVSSNALTCYLHMTKHLIQYLQDTLWLVLLQEIRCCWWCQIWHKLIWEVCLQALPLSEQMKMFAAEKYIWKKLKYLHACYHPYGAAMITPYSVGPTMQAVPLPWKTSTVPPLPKVAHPSSPKDYRPVSLTSGCEGTWENS